MFDINLYGNHETAWCPGCGNFAILAAIKQALARTELLPEHVLMVSGIGQAAKAVYYINANIFDGLHGRALPLATGAKMANPELTVIVESGDGCLYGEGGNHFMAAIRRNINITIVVHNNGIYGLTKGQASPTSTAGITSRAEPFGVYSMPFNPLTVALALGAGFVARGFSGDTETLPMLIAAGIQHQGIALVDVLTPCVSFNKFNTFAWYKAHCKPLPTGHNPKDKAAATALAESWDEGIYTGILYQNASRPTMESHFPMLKNGPLARQPVAMDELHTLQKTLM